MPNNERTGPRRKGTGSNNQVDAQSEAIVPEAAPEVLPPHTGLDLADRYRDVELAYAACVVRCGAKQIIAALDSDDLADPVAGAIHRAAVELTEAGQPVDAITLGFRLAAQPGDLQHQVAEVLTYRGAVEANWRAYADLVLEGAWRRRAVQAAGRLAQAANHGAPATLDGALRDAGRLARGNRVVIA